MSSLSFLNTTVGTGDFCAGSIDVAGLGSVQLTNTGGFNPTDDSEEHNVHVDNGKVVVEMGGRTYMSDSCGDDYDYKTYTKMPLLGKSFSYSTRMTDAGCGCNAALYLVSMAQNSDPSECGDYYCDANNVCGVRCAEIDIQEANEYAWHSTLHVYDDGSGVGGGYGGGGDNWSGPRDWTSGEFTPSGSSCIDTSKAFTVTVGFPTDSNGKLEQMTVVLSQGDCTLENSGLDSYNYNGRDGIAELSDALEEGMTVVMSYWSSNDMMWLDGKGSDGQGACDHDDAGACGDSVSFYNFAISDL